jgi:hypothetical protein
MSTDVSEVRAASIIALMREAARTSETSVDIQLRTRQYIPEDSELHTRRCQSLKSHRVMRVSTPSPSLLVLGGLASDSEKGEALTDSLEAQFQPANNPLSPAVIEAGD